MKNKNIIVVLLGIACAILIAAVGLTVAKDKKQEDAPAEEEERQTSYITYNGQKYKLDANVRTVLFMGIDKEAKADIGGTPGTNGQADSLNLLILNKESGKGQILQISRDSMVNLEIYGVKGEKVRKMEGQICLQYAYGDGESKSCRLTSDRVSELLGNIKIDSYIALTLDGVIAAADALGGVTLTVPEDYTAIDPAFTAGATVTLKGEQAEKYVRSRDTSLLDSNNQRMKRQSQFMNALIVQLKKSGETQSAAAYNLMYNLMKPFMETNLTADGMKEISEYEYAEDTITLPGEVIEKDGYAEYIVDTESLKEIVIDQFYVPQ